ncbi:MULTISPECIES: hypothetical protein [Photorhabdus]|uniref:hypothetical protein n=1 Tax=Photorhabdus TaxID=29487 RepID=UPI000DCC001A|nr:MULTISPECIES: hypothetical protein [Photorhabdus]MCT8343752.1 hypothetical protein [Photorhabdus kleinii]RAW96390.1 hypothetical protein CKY05_15555 [Photorhabdus sp. S10-54]RAW96590.1 hypothetical protein CKY03_14900 [Photorhabdus sp. S9-53]RAX00832.1 hypothetical protein CKY04_15205 [Photorhabdus sp. S8-52]
MFNGVHVIENAITEREINIIYRYLAISENLGHLKGNNDSTRAHMYYATPYFEAMLSHYCDLVSDIVNEKVYPSYSFLWNYKKEYALPKHKDRNSVDYIISIGIHTKEEADWSLYVENKPVNMKSGDLLILDGKKFEHWREPCPYKNRLQLILCYTRDLSLRFDKRLHLGYDPVPEVITSPFKEKLSIDDDYIKELSTYYV